MSRYQVDPGERIPIYEFPPETENGTPPNVIYIRQRMNVEQANRVAAFAAAVTFGADGQPMPGEQTGEYLTSLLIMNIVAWEGPDFDDLPCTPLTIRRLPSGDEFIDRVRNEIAQRNRPRRAPDQKKVTGNGLGSNGSKPSTAPQSAANPSADGTSR